MKKYLVALMAALMVCLLGITASAETAEETDTALAEQNEIERAYLDTLREMGRDVDLKTQMEIMTAAYEDAGWTVIEEEPVDARALDIDPEILELAYSDIDSADPEQREKIIDAREVVISNYSWINDVGQEAYLSYVTSPKDRTVKMLPLFSELFPGWDGPRPDPVEETEAEPIAEDELAVEDVATLDEQFTPVEAVANGASIARVVPGTMVVYDWQTSIPKAVNLTCTKLKMYGR